MILSSSDENVNVSGAMRKALIGVNHEVVSTTLFELEVISVLSLLQAEKSRSAPALNSSFFMTISLEGDAFK
jgi:hypothetical protein